MRQLAGMMGHSEITTTEMYAKHSPEFLQAAAGALDELFGTLRLCESAGTSGTLLDLRAKRAPELEGRAFVAHQK